jgi:YHS domain-containing protein
VLGWLLRLLLLFLLVRAVMLVVGGLFRGLIESARVPADARQPGGAAAGGPVARSQGTLVQDPVCGTYVLQERALTARGAGGTTAYFCSERCRSAYDAQAARPH